MESIKRFITQRLKLKVNETKSAVARPQVRKFLGFSFSDGPEIRRMIAPKAVERFKQRIREITRQARSVSLERTIAVLAPYMRGWRGYFGFCETPNLLIQLTGWVRRRLRAAMWRQWKTQRRRRAMLIQLGVRGGERGSSVAMGFRGRGLVPGGLQGLRSLADVVDHGLRKFLCADFLFANALRKYVVSMNAGFHGGKPGVVDTFCDIVLSDVDEHQNGSQ